MDDKLIEELKQFRNDNYNSFFDMGVVETRMYINSNNYVSFEIKISRYSRGDISNYQKRFEEAISNFKELYEYENYKHFNEYHDNWNIQEHRYLIISKKGK